MAGQQPPSMLLKPNWRDSIAFKSLNCKLIFTARACGAREEEMGRYPRHPRFIAKYRDGAL